ncbi:MAG: Gfo/Idh/MocA family oxidoreductase [Rhizomicrobium sp.]
MRVGFIGLGLIGARRFKIVRALGHEVAFAVDPKPPADPALALHEHRVVDRLEALTPDDLAGVKALFIAVPHDIAASYCHWAIDHGMHFFCEKPLGISQAEAEGVQQSAEAAGLTTCAGFNYRFLPAISELRNMLRAGRFGDLYRARLLMGHGGRPGMETEWKLKKARAGGGALIDPGIHLLDLVRDLFGEPGEVSGRLQKRFWETDVEDYCFVSMLCGGADVTVEVSLTSWKNEFSIEVYGSEGMAVLKGRGGNYGAQTLEFTNRWFWRDGDHRASVDFGQADPSFDAETQAFLQKVETGRSDTPLSTAEDGVKALRIVSALYAAQPR